MQAHSQWIGLVWLKISVLLFSGMFFVQYNYYFFYRSICSPNITFLLFLVVFMHRIQEGFMFCGVFVKRIHKSLLL
jgi:hypothetical protein